MLTTGIESWDERRDLIVPGKAEATIQFAAEHWVHSAQRAIQQRGRFAVALSGGSTPKAIYQLLAQSKGVAWDQVFLFWSDERAVPPDHPDSNYRMAMESGLKDLPIPNGQIFRMEAEGQIEKNAAAYEEKIRHLLGKSLFDLVMLGVGEDGHTASLFPNTKSLNIEDGLVAAIHLPQMPKSSNLRKETSFATGSSWRMTLTFPCIEQSRRAVIYALGSGKREIVAKILEAPIVSSWPASRIGTPQNKALWIVDADAAGAVKKP